MADLVSVVIESMSTEVTSGLAERAAVFAALSDPARADDRRLPIECGCVTRPNCARSCRCPPTCSRTTSPSCGRPASVRQTRSEADGRRTYLTAEPFRARRPCPV